MSDVRLTDEQWTKIQDFLRGDPNAYVGKDEQACRRFVEAVKWMSRSGAQWRLLPAEYGNWNSVYKRFVRWCEAGVWDRMLQHFAADPDMENGIAIWWSASSTRSSIFGGSSPASRNWIARIWAFCTLSAPYFGYAKCQHNLIMDKSDLTQKIEDWCTEKVQSLEIIEDTKHLCYAIVTSTRKMFVKVFHNNQETARNEFQLLSFLTTILLKYPTNTGYLWIPENLTYLTLDEFHSAIINRFITGITTKKILLENNIHALEICTVMMLAIARIHHTISTHTDDLNIDKKATTFGHWSDCKIRLKSLIRTEAEYILLDNDTDIINDFLYYYWEILFKSASGFPCDYYKDANPANWILTPASNLYAVDFESQRMLPCFVDLINITEFAKDYLTKDEKRSLLSTYLKERIRLDNHWSYIVKNFDIDLLLSLFAIYRHQEQLTHRVRDLKKNSSATWHIQAYFFHLDKLQIHIDQLEKSVRMPYKIIDSLNKIVYIYRQRFTDVFFAGE